MSRLTLISTSTLALLTVACAEAPSISIGGEPTRSEESQSALNFIAPGELTPSFAAPEAQPSSSLLEIPAPVAPQPMLREGATALTGAALSGSHEEAISRAELALEADAPALVPSAEGLEVGDVCSYSVADLAAPCTGSGEVSCGLEGDSFKNLYPAGLSVGEGALQVTINDVTALNNALPAQLDAAPLTESLIDPSAAELDKLSAELVALTLNIELARQGLAGHLSLEELRVTEGPFAGETVHTVHGAMSALLAGDEAALERYGMDIDALTNALAEINEAGRGCAAPVTLSL
jgi:hypothetical protein